MTQAQMSPLWINEKLENNHWITKKILPVSIHMWDQMLTIIGNGEYQILDYKDRKGKRIGVIKISQKGIENASNYR